MRPQDVPEGFTADQDTWYVARVCGTFESAAGWRGCRMPETALGRIIRACSDEEVVLDPFAGSGSTLVTARKLGRRLLGFELSPEYAAQARGRLEETRPGDPLSGGEEPKVALGAPPMAKSASKCLHPANHRCHAGCIG